jgi:hypothetical protein
VVGFPCTHTRTKPLPSSRIPLALMGLLVTSSANAQDTIEKSETTFYVQTAGGDPQICGIEFALLYRDRTYQQGAVAAITGTVAWRGSPGNVGLILKINGADFPNAAKSDWSTRAFPVHQGFVVGRQTAYRVHKTYPCEEPNSFCGFYWLPTSLEILEYVYSGTLSLGFSREAGGLDVVLPLDTRATSATNPQQHPDFMNCLVTILQRAKTPSR